MSPPFTTKVSRPTHNHSLTAAKHLTFLLAIRVYAGNTRGRSDNVELTIDGTLLMDELMSQMNAQLQQAGQQPERSPVRLLSRLSFDEVAGDNAYGSSTAAQPSPALSAVVSMQDEVSVQLFDEHYTPQHSSVWSGPAQVRTLRDGLSGLSGDNNSNNGSTNFTEIVRTRVLNPTADFLEGLHVYARDGTQAVPIGALSVSRYIVIHLGMDCHSKLCVLIVS